MQKHNQHNQALPWYQESLVLCRTLAQANPDVYLPYVAGTLNNLANLQKAKNDFPAAEAAYTEALEIYRTLAKPHPEVYLSYVAMTACNLGIFYLQSLPDKRQSLAFVREILISSAPFLEGHERARQSVQAALQVVQQWGEDVESFLGELSI